MKKAEEKGKKERTEGFTFKTERRAKERKKGQRRQENNREQGGLGGRSKTRETEREMEVRRLGFGNRGDGQKGEYRETGFERENLKKQEQEGATKREGWGWPAIGRKGTRKIWKKGKGGFG